MSKGGKIVLRVQSPDGTKRVEISDTSNLRELYELVHGTFAFNDYGFALFKERNCTKEIVSSRSQTVKESGLKHGDMIYLKHIAGPSTSKEPERSSSVASMASTSSSSFSGAAGFSREPTPSTSYGANASAVLNGEDSVDIELYKQDGRIQRKRDEKLCRHNSNGCCVHCSPLEPWDETYLKEQKIKHFSFHSHLKKLTSGVDRGKFVALEDLNCKIKTGCRDHPPWPKGICANS